MEALSYVDISDNQVEDISSVSNLKALSTFYASNTQITSVSPLVECPMLTRVNVEGNPVEDADVLSDKGLTEYKW